MPVFTTSAPMSLTTASIWAATISGDSVLDPPDALRVLGGDRRDDRRPVHAESGERLEVGLDAGSRAGVGPGYGHHSFHGYGPHKPKAPPAGDGSATRRASSAIQHFRSSYAGIIQIRFKRSVAAFGHPLSRARPSGEGLPQLPSNVFSSR